MKYLLSALSVLLLASCGTTEDHQVHQDSAVNVPPAVTITDVQPYRPNIETTPWDGDLSDAIYWKDSRGENAVIVSVKPQYFWEEENPEAKEFFPKGEDEETLSELTEIFVTHYVLPAGEAKWKQLNQHHDFLFGCCDVYLNYQSGSLSVTDADSSGTGEAILMYHETEGDGLLAHYNWGTLLLDMDGAFYQVEGPTGLGFDIEQDGQGGSLNHKNKLNLPANADAAAYMQSEWTRLFKEKVKQDREEVTEQNNFDASGHADHHH